ncbi:efflux transporter outer membrane subunit [Cyclobacteriaceae bacterium YHN15]|nr:efflux transporter outer membrane subunit [Cyclobacteriaceae bacterium YHN15]
MRKLLYIAIAVLLLGACKAGKRYQGANVLVPGQFKTGLTDAELMPSDTVNTDSIPKIGNANILWWESFDDPVLIDLIQKALLYNRNALIATERIMQARYALKIQNANFLPMIGAEASAERGNFLFNQIGQVNELFIAGSGLYWELDFWGRIRNLSDAARFNLLSSEYGLQSIQISLISDVASTYFNLLQAREEYEIAERNLALRDSMHQIIQLRFDKGIVPQTDVDQSQILKAIAAGSVPRFQRKTVQLENSLSFLVGMNPMHIATGKSLTEQKVGIELTGFSPSDLLSNRPDIIAAEYSLMAQNSQVGVAKANRLPTISLNATLGIISNNISDLSLKNPLWNLGGQLAGPLFFWGQLRRQVDIEQSKEYQALFSYENTVLNAFREVGDLKIEISTLMEEINIAKERKASALNAQFLSGERYSQGITSYLEFLESQRQAFDAELELVQLQQQLLSAYARMYRATGGGPVVQ